MTIPTAVSPNNSKEHKEFVEFINNSPKLRPKNFKMDDLKWKFAIRNVLRGDNTLFLGETGSGKTIVTSILAEVFKRPFFYFNMGGTQDARSTLIGNTHYKKEEGTFFAQSVFVRAIQIPDAIILLDELSRAHPDASNILMTALDQRQRYIRIDEHAETPTIKISKGVTFLATANVGTQYTTTRTMDRALLDRFSIIIMEPLSKEDEIDLLSQEFPMLDGYTITAIADIADITRKQVKSENPKINTIVSTRMTLKLAAICADGFTLSEAVETEVYPFFPESGGAEGERTFMRQLVQKYVKDDKTKDKTAPFVAPDDLNGGANKPWA